MALEKSIITKYGVTAKYWRISAYQEHLAGADAGKADYQIVGYITKAQRDNNNHPLEAINMTLTKAYKEDMNGAYSEIKKTKVNKVTVFDGAKDV
jgi:hypothetical protein